MFRRFLLTSGFILGGVIVYSPKTLAQDINVPFTGNIDTACQVQIIEPGTLVQSFDDSGILFSEGPGGPIPPENGFVELECNTPAALTITGVTAISTPEPDPPDTLFTVDVFGQGTGTDYSSDFGSALPALLDSGLQPLDVRLVVDRGIVGGSFSAGMYEYEVNMTVIPQ